MRRLIFWAVICVAAVGAASSVNWSAERVTDAQVPERWREPLVEIGKFVQAMDKGDLDGAYEVLVDRWPDRPQAPATPFEADFHADFRRIWEHYPRGGLESLDLVAVRRISSQAEKLSLVANTRHGPIIIEALIYQYRQDWYLAQVGFQVVAMIEQERWKNFGELFPLQTLAEPIPAPLQPPAATESK